MSATELEITYQWLGCWFGLAGAFCVAGRSALAGWGFVLFLISNLFWVAFSLATATPGLLVMQFGFVLTSLLGIFQWLITPWMAARRLTVRASLLRVPKPGRYRRASQPLMFTRLSGAVDVLLDRRRSTNAVGARCASGAK